MRELPVNQLDSRIKSVWRINDALWITLVFLCCAVPLVVLVFCDIVSAFALPMLIAVVVVYVLMLLVWLVILPPIRFMRWRYELSDNYLDISKGIIWKKRYIVPFVRVQNTDTQQGPIMRLFGLASVSVSTAASNHEIPGLSVDVADVLRDKAAELARLAKEDV